MLTAEEKDLLRQAICDGGLNEFLLADLPPQYRGGVIPLTPEMLQKISNLPDDKIKDMLAQYKVRKKQQLQQQIASIQGHLNKLQSTLQTLG
jgi:hypothetical protein